jgi:HEXXH motif-containing protein
MIDFSVDDEKRVCFEATALSAQLQERYKRAAELLGHIAASVALPSEDLGLISKHPLAQGLLAYQQGHIGTEVAEVLAAQLGEVDASAVDLLRQSRPCLLQLQSLLPEAETRGKSIRTVASYRYSQDKISRAFDLFTKTLGAGYQSFVSIIQTISIVEVPGMGEVPYFSGSDSNFWGAMHTTDPADDLVFAETLTHEAAHHWLLLVEDIEPLAKNCWDGNHWISPWRADARPIGGVVHGVFVFSCAALVLNILKETLAFDAGPSAERVEKRICRLYAQVEQGISELERCPDLTQIGRKIAADSRQRLDSFEWSVNATMLESERRRCKDEQDNKRRKHSHN